MKSEDAEAQITITSRDSLGRHRKPSRSEKLKESADI